MQHRLFVAVATTLLFISTARGQSIDWTQPDAIAREAVQRHPAIASLDAGIDAATERAKATGAYPNPMLMTGIQDLQIDLTRDEMMSMYMVGASQTVPRKERRAALRRSAGLAVDQLRLESRSLRQEIQRDILFAWYDLAAADSQTTATEQLGTAVDAIVAAARFRYEVGTTIQADVIRAQLERSQIDHQLLVSSGKRRVAASRLLAQLGLPVTTTIPRLRLAHSTEERTIDALPSVAEDHPALAGTSFDVQRREEELILAKLLKKPDWNLEASYGMRPTEKDVFTVTARIELPTRRKSVIEPQIRAAIAERDAATQRLDVMRRQLNEALAVAFEEHTQATRQLQLHEEVLVPQSKLAFDSSLAAYQSGKDNFEAVLISETGWLQFEIDYYDYLAQHIKSITDFEAIRNGARSGAIAGPMKTSSTSPTSSNSGSSKEMK